LPDNPDKAADAVKVRVIASQLLLALDYTHTRDVIHGDIKPDNVLMTENDLPVLSDFDVCRVASSLTMTVRKERKVERNGEGEGRRGRAEEIDAKRVTEIARDAARQILDVTPPQPCFADLHQRIWRSELRMHGAGGPEARAAAELRE
jgi:serine/threonine protein kinase